MPVISSRRTTSALGSTTCRLGLRLRALRNAFRPEESMNVTPLRSTPIVRVSNDASQSSMSPRRRYHTSPRTVAPVDDDEFDTRILIAPVSHETSKYHRNSPARRPNVHWRGCASAERSR